VTPDYLARGLMLWMTYLVVVLMRPVRRPMARGHLDTSWSFAALTACLVALLVALWPVSLPLILLSDYRRNE